MSFANQVLFQKPATTVVCQVAPSAIACTNPLHMLSRTPPHQKRPVTIAFGCSVKCLLGESALAWLCEIDHRCNQWCAELRAVSFRLLRIRVVRRAIVLQRLDEQNEVEGFIQLYLWLVQRIVQHVHVIRILTSKGRRWRSGEPIVSIICCLPVLHKSDKLVFVSTRQFSFAETPNLLPSRSERSRWPFPMCPPHLQIPSQTYSTPRLRWNPLAEEIMCVTQLCSSATSFSMATCSKAMSATRIACW